MSNWLVWVFSALLIARSRGAVPSSEAFWSACWIVSSIASTPLPVWVYSDAVLLLMNSGIWFHSTFAFNLPTLAKEAAYRWSR